jgi:comEA protein
MFNRQELAALMALAAALLVGAGVGGVEYYHLAQWEEFHVVPKAVEMPAPQEPVETGPVALNSATVVQLQRLSGIGPKTAGRIVAFRQEHGAFRSLEDLAQVKGIGQRTLEKFRSQLVLNAD